MRARARQTGTVGRRARTMGASESPRQGDCKGGLALNIKLLKSVNLGKDFNADVE